MALNTWLGSRFFRRGVEGGQKPLSYSKFILKKYKSSFHFFLSLWFSFFLCLSACLALTDPRALLLRSRADPILQYLSWTFRAVTLAEHNFEEHHSPCRVYLPYATYDNVIQFKKQASDIGSRHLKITLHSRFTRCVDNCWTQEGDEGELHWIGKKTLNCDSWKNSWKKHNTAKSTKKIHIQILK